MALLPGKVVCITGSSRGIGRACAIECAKQGAKGLILHYLGDVATEQEVQSLKEDIEANYAPAKAVVVAGDIGDPATSSKVNTRITLVASLRGLMNSAQVVEAGVAAFERIGDTGNHQVYERG